MLLALIVSLAAAQDVTGGAAPDLNAQFFRSTADGMGLLWTDQARRALHNQFAGRFVAHYTDEPFVYLPDEGEKIALVSSVMQADLVGAYAYDRLRVGAVVPIYLLSQSDLAGNETGLGDVAVDARVTLLDPTDSLPMGLGLQGRVFLPTATVTAPLGDPGVGWEVSGLIDADLTNRLLVAANVGVRGAPNTTLENVTLNDSFDGRLAAHYLIAPEPDVALALELASRANLPGDGEGAGMNLEWLLGGHGRIPDSSVVVRAGFGTGITGGVGTPDWRLVLGVGWEPPMIRDADGDGIVDDNDRCPQEPEDVDGFEDVEGCPDVDNDGDGVLDVADACMMEPEDKDSFEDENGCPDPDNDSDGVLDVRDVCPLEAEDKDGYRDDDGCPDLDLPIAVRVLDMEGKVIPLARATLSGGELKQAFKGEFKGGVVAGFYTVRAEANGFKTEEMTFEVKDPDRTYDLVLEAVATKVVVSRDRIDLKDKIFFDMGKATIQSRSFSLLDEAVQILRDYPEIEKLRVEGHTDSRGSNESNQKLSQGRADSVRQYFIDKGIDPNRLSAIGYGEERPLEQGENEAAWSKNRRVDFFVEVWKDRE
jgi:outer membrane protein OmpA-like peptidoglycan-associated protein